MEIIEVFKTNVETDAQAERLVALIQENFPAYAVNFDLNDSDRILRVKTSGSLHENSLLAVLHTHGVDAAILADEIPIRQEQPAPKSV